MRQTMVHCCVAALVGAVLNSGAFGAEPGVQVVVRADRPGAQISPTMYGVFFEDINFGADGGLYAELVKNRSFEFPEALMGWSEVKQGADCRLLWSPGQDPFNAANPHYVRIKAAKADAGYGIANAGLQRHRRAQGRGLSLLRLRSGRREGSCCASSW